ncbi:MAG: energy transducer TonB [Alphaproteobacteria bacterium]
MLCLCRPIAIVVLSLMGATIPLAAAAQPDLGGDIEIDESEEFSVYLGPLNTPVEVNAGGGLIVVHRERARWPRVAAKKNLSGCVIYEFSIDGSGSVTAVRAVDATSELFVPPGMDALYRYQFMPPPRPGESEGEDESETKEEDTPEPDITSRPHLIQLVWKLRSEPLPVDTACTR